MNNRIRELAEQAMAVREDGWSEFDVEKFAQLIAQQCANLAMTQHISTSPDDYDNMEPYHQGCDDTASRISRLICRIFEVK